MILISYISYYILCNRFLMLRNDPKIIKFVSRFRPKFFAMLIYNLYIIGFESKPDCQNKFCYHRKEVPIFRPFELQNPDETKTQTHRVGNSH